MPCWPCSGCGWLHAAQAPVRPRHCTQALLQQPDQRILSNTLPRPAARALFSLHLPSVSLASRFCAPAPADGSVDSIGHYRPQNVRESRRGRNFTPPHHRHFFHTTAISVTI